MAITTLYSTNDSMAQPGQSEPNAFQCAVALAVSDDRGEYCVSVINFREVLNRSSYAIFDRDELKLLYAAIGAELKATEN
jgi:hypothetical protein